VNKLTINHKYYLDNIDNLVEELYGVFQDKYKIRLLSNFAKG